MSPQAAGPRGRLNYLTSVAGFIDLVTLLPMIQYLTPGKDHDHNTDFIRLLLVLRVFKAARVTRLTRYTPTMTNVDPAQVINYQIKVEWTTLGATIFSFVFVFTSIMHMLHEMLGKHYGSAADADRSPFTNSLQGERLQAHADLDRTHYTHTCTRTHALKTYARARSHSCAH